MSIMPDLKSDKISSSSLQFSLKGSRNYIQGGSFYQSVTEYISSTFPDRIDGTFQMVVHGFTKKKCDFIYTLDSERLEKPEYGKVEIITSTGIHGWLVETKQDVIDRVPFPENEIVESCLIGDDRSVVMNAKVSFDPIEVLVAITKHLHQDEYPNVEGKWIFTRLELDRLLKVEDAEALGVQIKQSVGTRLTKSAIVSGNETIGKIYFSMVSEWPE